MTPQQHLSYAINRAEELHQSLTILHQHAPGWINADTIQTVRWIADDLKWHNTEN